MNGQNHPAQRTVLAGFPCLLTVSAAVDVATGWYLGIAFCMIVLFANRETLATNFDILMN